MAFRSEYPALQPSEYLLLDNDMSGLPDLNELLGASFTTTPIQDSTLFEVKQEDILYATQNNGANIPVVELQAQQDLPDDGEPQETLRMPSFIASNEFGGEFDFEVEINPHHGKKSPWVYSSPLNKIFIVMNQLFPIDFKCKYPEDDQKLYVRATPIYSQLQYAAELVTRCINHAHSAELTNKGFPETVWHHVIRCYHRTAEYGGSKADGRHLFVRIPVLKPQAGADTFQLQFKFMCQNSCGSETGMNRRPIDVVFTLEDKYGEILGRRVLSVRICSCPKRDKDKEEIDYYKKADTERESTTPTSGKKRKLDRRFTSSQESIIDTKEYKLEIPVIGAANVRAIYKYASDLMAGEMYRHKTEQPYTKCIEDIEEKLNTPLE